MGRKRSPPVPWEGKPGWLDVDCGCCGGLEWGGEYPRECTACGGSGRYALHEETGTIALYPGGPFLGSLPNG